MQNLLADDLKKLELNMDTKPSSRLMSIDLFRGIIMFLLMIEGVWAYYYLNDLFRHHEILGAVFSQFEHVPWEGLSFWDNIQPAFMFIVGVVMPISYIKRRQRGQSNKQITFHTLIRCMILLVLGILIHYVQSGFSSIGAWNVLAQLSITILVTYFMMRKKIKTQVIVSISLVLLTSILYRIYSFGSPFIPGHNFGAFIDNLLVGYTDEGHWVMINFLPTTAHTMWGAICGWILINDYKPNKKISTLIISGIIGLVIGYTLHFTGVEPIIKRISTMSFVFVTGGYSILTLTLFYYLIDIKKILTKKLIYKLSMVFIVVGMNCILIYVFFSIVGELFWNDLFLNLSYSLFDSFQLSDNILDLLGAALAFIPEWVLCYVLYKKKIFIKI